uniref:GST N-terminal domain-containing protein n=1 Tax=Kwoniella pini CBS 10737 TaxID=1296096 RepID=A0A1B9HXZ1_9TREE|nr:uncharacterized protein I206_06005 [Kwoniella pini CBS 10737]OCF48137.1 hypothetical protein I206_06005 [Kwoniella pini CBS 10737]
MSVSDNGVTKNGALPKAILYSWPTSVWSTVPQLCLHEKGYSSDEYVIKLVDITKGENFAPSYLKINLNGTIPTLVVPTLETTGNDVDTKYRSLRDTISICDFLDQARSASSGHNSHSNKPAPTLAPATIEGKGISDEIINLIHLYTVDPNFVALAVRDEAELKQKATRPPGKSLAQRRQALRQYLDEAKQAVANSAVVPKEGSSTWEQKTVNFLEEKFKSNEQIWELYNGQSGDDKKEQFFEVCRKTWTESLPNAFSRLEGLIKGPFALGDQISLADLHAISWLTRLVTIAGGPPDASGIDSLIPHMSGYKFGPKVREFWSEWVQRESFKLVLVPVSGDFEKMSGL